MGAVLNWSDPLTIRTVAALHAEILNKFSEHDNVSLEFSDQLPADLSAVQLIETARRFAAAQGKQFSLAAPAGGPLRDVLARGGFLEGRAPEDRAFWLHEEVAA